MDELQEMREQLAALKEKLNKQEVVNDRLIRDVLRQKMKVVNQKGWISGIAALFVITFGNWMFHQMGLSVCFIIGTTIMMTICCVATWISHSWVKADNIATGDLLIVAKQVGRLRKVYVNWIYIAIPMIVIWFSWLSFEYYHIVQDYIATTAMLSGGLIGGLIGGILGFKQNKKVVRELDEMLRQINDISELDLKKG
jgi:uncharacterized membrane protein